MDYARDAAHAEGKAEGLAEGLEKGMEQGQRAVILTLSQKGLTSTAISELLDLPVALIHQVMGNAQD